ncbi:UDP-glucuronosyltransferase 2A3-like [Tamandua tetradactyla]|uniref:UDP-glucuronosyltransferase 2A3-like n=1 Tax=Tamandua tetradactyla TaxID=48850 RepID=UPI0040541594
MMIEKGVPVLLLLWLCCVDCGLCGKVLGWPCDMSHWLNIKIILEELIERGHDVTVLAPSHSFIIDNSKPSTPNFKVVPIPNDRERFMSVLNEFLDTTVNVMPKLSYWQSMIKLQNLFLQATGYVKLLCENVVYNQTLMKEELKETNYNVMIIDPVLPCGELIAEVLGVPFVHTLRSSLAGLIEKNCGKLPIIPSYVPVHMSRLGDKMTFMERVKNLMLSIVSDFWLPQYEVQLWDQFYSEVLDASHWLNIKIILEELMERGHEVTVLVPSHNYIIDDSKPSTPNFKVVPVPNDEERSMNILNDILDAAVNVMPKLSYWQSVIKLQELLLQTTGDVKLLCENVVYNKTLMKKLKETNYNVMIIDPVVPCGELIAEALGVPFVHTLRASIGGTLEKYCGKLSAPPSYVPVPMAGLRDKMTFLERLKNLMLSLLFDFWFQPYDVQIWDQFYSEVLGRPTTLCETVGKAEIWLIRTYWDFEYPRPYLPNFEFVGGLHCKPAKPLPKEMEEFVQSSGEDGVVVFSLGSMVKNLPKEKANLIASALAQIPQKVLWRYKGKEPTTLGANTRLYDWIPQNDLLGHPKTRAFVTHGGMNGIYEAIYHGVPLVGIPLFVDQPDNILNMKAKGAAVDVSIDTMTSADLLRALRTVINEPSYKENAMRLSKIHHDQPIKPLDRAVFWIEFVMRHKGAKHLRPAAHDLTWLQYHSLDVIGFLLACVATTIFLVTKSCLFFCQKINKAGKKKKRE